MRFLKNRFVIGCICIIVAFAIGFVGIPLLTNSANQKITVVIARDYISKGSEITPAMLSEHNISRGDIPYSSGTFYTKINQSGNSADMAIFTQSSGKMYASCDIYANDMITTQKISSQYPYTDMTIRTLDNNHYAVAVGVPSLSAGVAGKVREGDVLTLLIYSNKDDVFIDSYLNYMKVISVSNSEATDITDNAESNKSKIPSVITFEATLEQSMLLAKYNSNYGIHYALAARADTDKANLLLNEQNKALQNSHTYGRLEDQL